MCGQPDLVDETQAPLPTPPEAVLKKLDTLDIAYTHHTHEPIFTVAEGEHLKAAIPGVHTRNLFMRDKKKNTFLVVLGNDTEIDLKKLSDVLGCGRLSFGSPDRLWEYLGIRPGSVNPFTILNDPENQVQLILEADMMKADIVNYHPNDNAATIGLTPADLIRFIEAVGHNYRVLDLSAAAPDA